MTRMLCILACIYTAMAVAAEPTITAEEKDTVISELAAKLKPVMGKDWEELYAKFQPKLGAAKSKAKFYGVVREMFAATEKSHFFVLPPETEKLDHGREAAFAKSGMVCSLVGDAVTVVSVIDGSPAAVAGITPGFVIDALDGVALKTVVNSVKRSTKGAYRRRVTVSRRINYWLGGAVGAKRVVVGTSAKGKAERHELVLKRPKGTYIKQGHLGEEWMEFEAKRLNEGTVGYVRFNIFLMPLMAKIRKAVKSFASCKAIILDLRGNPGGLGMMAIPVAGMFLDKRGNLGETRSGTDVFRYPVFPVKNPYKGRLIVLTNELTASTSEILAAGLQECGRATVVGTRTMGAVLPSLVIKLANGGIVQYPIGDFKTPKGTLLEGRGVKPDVLVTFDKETLAMGGDPILSHALKTITKTGDDDK